MQNTVTQEIDLDINFLTTDATAAYKATDLAAISPNTTGYIDNVRSIYSNAKSPLENTANSFIKRAFDIVLSVFGVIFILSWSLPILMLLIKLDSKGPVFFLQKRKKKNGAIFTCIKLRTMIINEEANIKAAADDDKRITRIGKFLRRSHLDELPQIFNVLIGDMSIIGPRPYMIAENFLYEKEIKEYANRYHVKPGITGLAQSFGFFGFTDDLQKIDERVMLDLLYIKRWSFKMDIQILFRTLRTLF